jgi:glycosyltransferase involved in cell wall biosynthesis
MPISERGLIYCPLCAISADPPCPDRPNPKDGAMQPNPIEEQGRPQRVILFGSYAPSLINFRGPLIRALIGRGHQVFALAPDLSEEVAAQLRALGAEPVEIALERASLDPRRVWDTAGRAERRFRALRPDVVIAYTITPIVVAAAAARAVGARFVPMITGLGYPFLGGWHPRRLAIRIAAILMYRRALCHAEIVLFQNKDDLRDFRRYRALRADSRAALVNGSGVDLAHFAARPPPSHLSFLMIARFLKDKGIREYGEAAARLKREHPDISFRLAGWLDRSPDSISSAELDAIVSGGVEYLGKLDDVRDAIAQCSVYVLPSYREGTPRSVLEAMAIGRAVVTTDAPGCRETVVEGENGFLVPPRDAMGLESAMRRFIAEPDVAARMGAASRRIAEEKFDVAKVNGAILGFSGL